VLTDKGVETGIRRYEIILIKRFRMEQTEFTKVIKSSSGLIIYIYNVILLRCLSSRIQ